MPRSVVDEGPAILGGVLAGIARAPGRAARQGKAWRDRIFGTVQKTGTPGHQARSYREAIGAATNPASESVHLDQGPRGTTGEPVSPDRRPDVTVVAKDGRARQVEVPSRTDDPRELERRMEVGRRQLPEGRQETNGLSDITRQDDSNR